MEEVAQIEIVLCERMRQRGEHAHFEDVDGEDCSIELDIGGVEKLLWLGNNNYRMLLSQEHVKALLPLLQHFAETGELPK